MSEQDEAFEICYEEYSFSVPKETQDLLKNFMIKRICEIFFIKGYNRCSIEVKKWQKEEDGSDSL